MWKAGKGATVNGQGQKAAARRAEIRTVAVARVRRESPEGTGEGEAVCDPPRTLIARRGGMTPCRGVSKFGTEDASRARVSLRSQLGTRVSQLGRPPAALASVRRRLLPVSARPSLRGDINGPGMRAMVCDSIETTCNSPLFTEYLCVVRHGCHREKSVQRASGRS